MELWRSLKIIAIEVALVSSLPKSSTRFELMVDKRISSDMDKH
jgi:hypothetical protein